MKDRLFGISLLCLPVLLAGVLLGYINTWIIAIAIILSLFMFNRHEAIVAFSLMLGPVLGLLFPIMGIGLPGSIISFLIAFLLMRKEIILCCIKYTKSIMYLMVIVGIIFLFYLLAGPTPYSTDKFIKLLITLAASIIGIICLATYSDIDLEKLAVLALLIGIIYISIALNFMLYSAPNGLFDFSFFRDSTVMNKNNDLPYLPYHSVGITAMTGACYIFAKNKISKFSIIMLLVSVWVIMLSGARQALFGFCLSLLLWYIIKGKSSINLIFKILIAFIGVVLFLDVLREISTSIDIKWLQDVFEKEDVVEGMNRNYYDSWSIFNRNIVLGVGFGHYFNPATGERYAHNLFLEILCEMGLVGFIMIFGVVLLFCFNNPINIRQKLPNACYTVLIVLPDFIRSMISGHLGDNIIIFSLLFILFSHQNRQTHENNRSYCNRK